MKNIININTKSAKGRFVVGVLVMLVFSLSLSAAEWYVDPVNGNDEIALGSKDSPFLSIQKAVDSASENDTVVLLPGDHIAGCTEMVDDNSKHKYRARVSIDKRLVIRSLSGRAGRDETRIVGEWDTTPGDYPYGMGSNAVKCAEVKTDAVGTRFEGITFCDGSAPYLDGGDSIPTRGGGVNVWGVDGGFAYFTDCAFRRCQAIRGGAINVGNAEKTVAARCLFKDNRASKYGSATRGVNCFACVFDGNDATRNKDGVGMSQSDGGTVGVIANSKMVVNCTIVNSYNRVGYSVGKLCNSIFLHGYYSNWASSVLNVYNIVSDVDPAKVVSGEIEECENLHKVDFIENPEVYSPYDEDYRLRKNAVSIGAGAMEYITEFAEMFPEAEGMLGSDYNGNEYPNANSTEHVNCGALQSAVEFESSCLGLSLSLHERSGSYEVNGRNTIPCGYTFIGLPECPTAFQVKFTPKSGKSLIRYNVNGKVVWPKMDGSVWVASQKLGQAVDVKAIDTANITYVDAENGNDVSGTGSEGAPYKTIQKAINQANKDYDHVIYARKGDYNEGTTAAKGLRTRVVIPGKYQHNMLIKAMDGADETFISGELDSTDNGMGDNAVRCIALANISHAICIQGFTLRNGRTAPGSSGSGDNTYGAAIYGASGAYLVDCIISNCTAHRGIVVGSILERCKIIDCTVTGRGFVRGGTSEVISSLIKDCTLTSGNGAISDGAKAYNCTFVNSPTVVRGDSGQKGYIYNCVVDGKIASPVLESDQAYNTLYKASDKSQVNLETAIKENPIAFSDSSDYALSRNSKGYGLADIEYIKSVMDLNGNPFKISNTGKYTAGAFERDWKNDIALTSGTDGIEVLSAYSTATIDNDKILLPNGNLTLRWNIETTGCYDFHVEIKGNGKLAVFLDEALLGTYSSKFEGDVRFVTKTGNHQLRLLYTSSEKSDDGVVLSDFGRYVGSRVLIQ